MERPDIVEGTDQVKERTPGERAQVMYDVLKNAAVALEGVNWITDGAGIRIATIPGRNPGTNLNIRIDESTMFVVVAFNVPQAQESAYSNVGEAKFAYSKQRGGDINYQPNNKVAESNIKQFASRLSELIAK